MLYLKQQFNEINLFQTPNKFTLVIIALLEIRAGMALGVRLSASHALLQNGMDELQVDLKVFSTSWRWDRGLGHRQLLSQIVEASDVVHAALAHHAGKLSVHLHKTKELKHSNYRTNPTYSTTTGLNVPKKDKKRNSRLPIIYTLGRKEFSFNQSLKYH